MYQWSHIMSVFAQDLTAINISLTALAEPWAL